MATLKVHRIYAGHGIARKVEIQVPNKPGYHYKFEFVGSLWSWRTWTSAGEQFSRGDAVVRIGKTLYRLLDKTAKPLVMRDDEYFRPDTWHQGQGWAVGYRPTSVAHAS